MRCAPPATCRKEQKELSVRNLASLVDVPFGSIATEMGCPRYVCFSPVSDRRTDIAECLKRANNGSG